MSRAHSAPTSTGFAAGLMLIARLASAALTAVVGLIVAAILLRLFGANPANDLVSWVHDAGRSLVGPFHGIFTLHSDKTQMVVNWGIAAIVYALVGGYVVGLLYRSAVNSAR